MSHQKLEYRPDIDGLRTIAVCAVVTFHAFPGFLPGGFVGVDIFFVISGFLITGILVREYDLTGRVSLAEFYARRARRLLPALLTVLATTLVLGLWLLPATGELQSLAHSTLAALFFASNIFFALQPSGYFAAAPETYPLLHTWTLAVEEQFYIIWPLLIPLVGWIASGIGIGRRRALWALFAIVFLASLACSIVVTVWRPTLAFYLTPFRGWEFAIGAMLSLLLHGDRAWWHRGASAISVVGLVLIGSSLYLFNNETPFPGWIAIVPTSGAALLLAAGAVRPANPVSRMLATPPAVYIGKLSYGWYLWHWPLLAMVRSHALGKPDSLSLIAAIIVSFVLSALSFHFIETPVRGQSWALFRSTRSALISAGTMLMTGAAMTGVIWIVANHTLSTSPRLARIAEAMRANDLGSSFPPACNNYATSFRALPALETCLLGRHGANRIVIVIGDSHGFHLVPMLDRWGRARNVAVLPRTRGGCRPLSDDMPLAGIRSTEANLADCKTFNDAVFAEMQTLATSGRLVGVMVGSRWQQDREPFAIPNHQPPNGSGPITDISRLVALSHAHHFRIAMTRDTPFFAFDIPRCLARRDTIACSISRKAADGARSVANAAITRLAGQERTVRAFDPSQVICDARFCYPDRNGVVLFKDQGHLSIVGSRALEPLLRRSIDVALLAP